METLKNLETMVKEANAENASFDAIPADIATLAEKQAKQTFIDACKVYALMDTADFFKAFFCPEIASGLEKDNDIMNAVKNSVAVSVDTVIINDTGLLEIKPVAKSIAFADVVSAYIAHLAFAHADNKPTKADRVQANARFYGVNGNGLCDMLTHAARRFMSVGNVDDTAEKLTTNANYAKASDAISALFSANGKENPFTKTSNSAYCDMLTFALSMFMPENGVKVTAYHCKAMFQMVCARNKFGKLTIGNNADVMQAMAIVCRYANAGYKLPVGDKSGIYKK